MSAMLQKSSFPLTQSNTFQPWQLMAREPATSDSSPAYAIGQAIRAGFDAVMSTGSSPAVQEFSSLHQTLFKNNTIQIVYAPLDPGVDDTANVLGLKASVQSGSPLQFVGFVPQTGNAVLEDTEKNTACALKQTESHDPIYPGALAPLGVQNNKTATNAYLKQTEAFGFYGKDGWPLDRARICPDLNTKIQCQQGYNFVAEAIVKAQTDKPVTIVSSAALTTLAQSFMELERIALQKGLPIIALTQNIACISMMAGCVDPETCGPNAPFDKPDFSNAANCTTSTDPDFNPPCKISEANLFADPEAAQYVFSFCARYNIAVVLSPLDLTQQTQLLWTPLQTAYLEGIDTAPAQAMAKIAKPVPLLDQPCFPPLQWHNISYA